MQYFSRFLRLRPELTWVAVNIEHLLIFDRKPVLICKPGKVGLQVPLLVSDEA